MKVCLRSDLKLYAASFPAIPKCTYARFAEGMATVKQRWLGSSGRPQRAKGEAIAHRLIDLGAVAPLVRRQGPHPMMDRRINRQHPIDRGNRRLPPQPHNE